jgi:DCN1-like protein 4/5
MRRSSKKSSSSAAPTTAGGEQVNEKQNRKRKGVSTDLTSRKAQRGPTKAVSKEIERIDQFFYTYADRSSGIIDPEGIETLCSHLEVPHTDVRILMLAWKMGSEKQGYFTLDEWRTALKALRADNISKLKKTFPELVQEVMRPSNFLDFYTYSFRYCLTEDKKCIEVPVACELLNLVLGLQFRPQIDKLTNYLKYQTEYKVINMDQWMGFYRFCNEINFPSLDNYDSDLAWPLILDNFVEWLRENKS